MFKFNQGAGLTEYAATALMFVTAAVIGHEAAVGMTPSQWLAAGISILGSISVGAMVCLWPAKAKAKSDPPRQD